MAFYRKHTKENHTTHLRLFLRDSQLWRAVFCEFFGTFLLVFIGLASVLPSEVDPNLDNLIVPGLCFLAIIVTLIHIIGPTSGCNINPSVTLALVCIRRLNPIKGLLYFVAQMIGATAGAGYLYIIAPKEWVHGSHLGMTRLNSSMNVFQGIGMEITATMVLVLLVLVISDPDPNKDFEGFPSLSGGLAVLACVYAAAPYTGASLNPARSFGPALVMFNFENHWIYWVGPLTGALIAVVIYNACLVQGLHPFLTTVPKKDEESKAEEKEIVELKEPNDVEGEERIRAEMHEA